MDDQFPPPAASLRAGHELRDVNVSLVVAVAIVFVLTAFVLLLLLWEMSRQVVPEQKIPGTSPPVLMPGEPPVDDRIRSVPRPRLDPLEPLEAIPSSYRSSSPIPATAAWRQRPEDLRADRQPQLAGSAWIEPGKVARLPIGVAMDAVVESGRTKAAPKGGQK